MPTLAQGEKTEQNQTFTTFFFLRFNEAAAECEIYIRCWGGSTGERTQEGQAKKKEGGTWGRAASVQAAERQKTLG